MFFELKSFLGTSIGESCCGAPVEKPSDYQIEELVKDFCKKIESPAVICGFSFGNDFVSLRPRAGNKPGFSFPENDGCLKLSTPTEFFLDREGIELSPTSARVELWFSR